MVGRLTSSSFCQYVLHHQGLNCLCVCFEAHTDNFNLDDGAHIDKNWNPHYIVNLPTIFLPNSHVYMDIA